MRTSAWVFTLLVVLGTLTLGLEGTPVAVGETVAAASLPALVQPGAQAVDRLGEGLRSSYYPRCSSIWGSYCSTPGSLVRCQWTPYEPEICVCLYSHVWQC